MTTGQVAAGADWAQAAQCLALDAFTVQTTSVLRDARIPSLLLKGPATAHRLYPDRPDQRPYTDVDLLVPPDRFADAERALARAGYRSMLVGIRPGEFPWHETAWSAPTATALHLDLHRGFAGASDAGAFFSALWATRELLMVGGESVAVPSPAGTALIVALHAASPGRGRKPLVDVLRAGSMFDTAIWQEAAAMARGCDAVSACRAGLELLPGGAEFADRLGLTGTVSTDQWLKGRQLDRVSVSLAALLAQDGTVAAVRLLVRKLLPSPAFVRLWDAPARRGRVGLAFAYGRRLRRAALAAPRAVADVRAARRQGHRVDRVPAMTWLQAARPAMAWLIRADRQAVATARWAVQTHRRAREQLAGNGVTAIALSAPSSQRAADRRTVAAVLRARRATCLERSVILQRFDAAAGRPRELVIAVTAPGSNFRAHAWLDGERPPGGQFHEMIRHAPQPLWLSRRP